MAAIVPFFGLPAVLGRARRTLARHPVLAGGAAAGAPAVVIAGVIGVTGMDGYGSGGHGRADHGVGGSARRGSRAKTRADHGTLGFSTAATAVRGELDQAGVHVEATGVM